MKKKFLMMMCVMSLGLTAFAGCGSKPAAEAPAAEPAVEEVAEEPAAEEPAAEEPAEEEDEENYETGDASLDNPRNQDDIGEKEILVVSFGTSYNDSRRMTIGGIESAIEEAFPEYSVRRAFTSQIIIDHVKDRDGVVIDNVKEALDRAVANGVTTLVVQPTHLMDGYEYGDLVAEVAEYADSGKIQNVAVGYPLLYSDQDFDIVAGCIADATSQYDDGETAICFMGHGTEADSNSVYAKMQETLHNLGYENYYVGTVEAEPSFQDVIDEVSAAGKYKKAVLKPLMVVAGDHANNDMASDEDDSWKSMFKAAGFDVECVIEGLGQDPNIQDLYVEHTNNAINAIVQ